MDAAGPREKRDAMNHWHYVYVKDKFKSINNNISKVINTRRRDKTHI